MSGISPFLMDSWYPLIRVIFSFHSSARALLFSGHLFREKTKVMLLGKQRGIFFFILTEPSVSNIKNEQTSHNLPFLPLLGHTTSIKLAVWITFLKWNSLKVICNYRRQTLLFISRDVVTQKRKYGKQRVLKVTN